MAKVSVIIAAHNKEDYLAECVESVLAQTLEDIEAVVVDDASTDKTLEIAKRLRDLDDRVKIVEEKERHGLLCARKKGFAASTGEYIMFADVHDTLTSRACEKAYQAIVKAKTDIVQFGVAWMSEEDTDISLEDRSENEKKERKEFPYVPHKVVASKEGGLWAADIRDGRISGKLWDKIYKRAVVEKSEAEMPDTYFMYGEDLMLATVLQINSHSYKYIDDELYLYRSLDITGGECTSQEDMDAFAKLYSGYDFLYTRAKEQNLTQSCERQLDDLRDRFLDMLVLTFVNDCPREDQPRFMERIMQQCPMDVFLAHLSKMMHFTRVIDPVDVADAFCKLPQFQPKSKQIRTVAMFYFRVHNGGIESAITSLMNLWVKNGYNVVLFTDEKPNEKEYYLDPNVKRVVLPVAQDRGFDTFRKRIEVWRTNLIQYNVDALVYNAWLNPAFMPDALAIKSTGAFLIAHTHGMFCTDMDVKDLRHGYTNTVLHKYYQLADMVVTLSETDKAYWQSYGLRCMKTLNPIRMSLSTQPAPLKGKNLLFVGRVSPEKQVLDLLKILAIVRKKVPDATLTIVGEAEYKPYERELKDFIRKNDLEDAVEMAGFSTEVLPYYQKSDVMLCTSKFEGFCLTIAESKICGLPLVTYELPNLDFIRDGKGMFVVEQNDVQAAAEHVIELLTDDELRHKMGNEAHENAMELFSLDLAEHWNLIFAETLKPKEEKIALYQRPPLETALGLMSEFTARGIRRRGQDGGGSADVYELLHYMVECNALDATIKEIRSSTSYRIGRAITLLPGTILNLLRRLFKRK